MTTIETPTDALVEALGTAMQKVTEFHQWAMSEIADCESHGADGDAIQWCFLADSYRDIVVLLEGCTYELETEAARLFGQPGHHPGVGVALAGAAQSRANGAATRRLLALAERGAYTTYDALTKQLL